MAETQALAPMEQFQEKLRKKIRDDFAEMLPEEVLDQLQKKAIEDAFFKERKVTVPSDGSWNSKDRTEVRQPLVQEIARECAEEAYKAAILVWFKEHEEEILEKFDDFISMSFGENLLMAFGKIFRQETQRAVSELQIQVYKLMHPNG